MTSSKPSCASCDVSAFTCSQIANSVSRMLPHDSRVGTNLRSMKLWDGNDVIEASVNGLLMYVMENTPDRGYILKPINPFWCSMKIRKNLNAGHGAFQPFWPLGNPPTYQFQSTHSQAGRSTPQFWNSDWEDCRWRLWTFDTPAQMCASTMSEVYMHGSYVLSFVLLYKIYQVSC